MQELSSNLHKNLQAKAKQQYTNGFFPLSLRLSCHQKLLGCYVLMHTHVRQFDPCMPRHILPRHALTPTPCTVLPKHQKQFQRPAKRKVNVGIYNFFSLNTSSAVVDTKAACQLLLQYKSRNIPQYQNMPIREEKSNLPDCCY